MATYSLDEVMQGGEKKTYSLEEVMSAQPEQQAAPQKQGRAWSDVPGEALGNIPTSGANFIKGIYQTVTSPIESGKAIIKAGQGAALNIAPDWLRAASTAVQGIGGRFPSQTAVEANQTADALGGFYKNRYGGMENIKETLATDPVGAASDLSAVLSGGAALSAKVPMLTRGAATPAFSVAGRTVPSVNLPSVQTVLNKGAGVTNPINAITKPVVAGGKLAAETIGAFGTHTGGMPIREAFSAGLEGGKRAKAFRTNMRGQVPMTDVLDDVKANVAAMGKAKSEAYRSGMAQVSGDKSVLAFDGIDDAMRSASEMSRFKGQVKNAKAAEVVGKINNEIAKWKKLDPAEFHTPEGLDALKQRVGGIVESIPFEEKTARAAANQIYHSIKGEITRQAPTYAKTMKDYADAVDEIKEIEKALSTGQKASVDTAMRKLQSLTRNNVNTNYGNRLDLAKTLEQKGGIPVMPQLAGQALNTWTPRGIGGVVSGGVGLGGYVAGGLPGGLAALAVQSPRLVGETAYALGRASTPANAAAQALVRQGIDPKMLINLTSQYGLLQDRSDKP